MTLAPRRPPRLELEDRLFGVALFFVALAPRLWVALRWAAEPVWDGHYYDFGARRIAAGLGYSDDGFAAGHAVWHPWCHYPVGYSAFLGACYRVFGPSLRVAAMANATVGALLAVVTWMLARHALSSTRSKLAGLFVAMHPGLVLYAGLLMSEPLSALGTLVAFLVAVSDARPRRGVVLGALVLGVSALVRPQALLCAPALAFVLPQAALHGSSKRTAKGAGRGSQRMRSIVRFLAVGAAACAIALVPVLPWTARNCRVMDGCALVSTNAGWNLAIGAFPRATGRFETLKSSDGCREVTGQVQQDRCWLAYGIEHVKKTPGRWLGLMPKKLGYTFDHESFAVEYLRQARPEEWPEERRVRVRQLVTQFHCVLLALAALGCVGFARKGRGAAVQGALAVSAVGLAAWGATADAPTFWPLAVFASVVPWLPLPGAPPVTPAMKTMVALLATTALTHAVFFGEDRYHVVVTPVLAVLAAGAMRGEGRDGASG